jgi:hypothetical protein
VTLERNCQGCVLVRVPDELVKLATWGRRDCAAAWSGACGCGTVCGGGQQCSADEEIPVDGKGLRALVFVAPESDEFDGKQPGLGRGSAPARESMCGLTGTETWPITGAGEGAAAVTKPRGGM